MGSSITITPGFAAAIERDPEFKEAFSRQVRALGVVDQLIQRIAGDELRSAFATAIEDLTRVSSEVSAYNAYVDANAQFAEAGHKSSTTTLKMPDVIFQSGAIQLQLPPNGLDVNVHQESRSVVIERDEQGQMVAMITKEP
jgi:hypothetical protein